MVDESWRAPATPREPRQVALSIPVAGLDGALHQLRCWQLSQQCFDALCAQAGLVLQARASTWDMRPAEARRMSIVSIYAHSVSI